MYCIKRFDDTPNEWCKNWPMALKRSIYLENERIPHVIEDREKREVHRYSATCGRTVLRDI